MTYNVFSGTLNLTQPTKQRIVSASGIYALVNSFVHPTVCVCVSSWPEDLLQRCSNRSTFVAVVLKIKLFFS